MKTLEEIYREVIASEQLKTEFTAAVKAGTVDTFLTAHGCDATSAEATTFLKERQAREGELAEQELDAVAGGGCSDEDDGPVSVTSSAKMPVASIVNICS